MTVSIRSVRPVVERLRRLGLDVEAGVAGAGGDPTALADAEARIPHLAALALWDGAARQSGDDAFGIHVAEDIRSGAFDVLDYAIRASATLGRGLDCLVRYHRLLHDAAVVLLRVEGDAAWLEHGLPPEAPPLPRHVAEYIVAGWLVVARQATGIDLAPVEVSFRHPSPPDLTEHHRLFRAPVRFARGRNGLKLPRTLLDAPHVRSDAGLHAVLEQYVRELLGRLPATTGLGQRVRHVIAADLSAGVDADAVARKLHMSRRTLHRGLVGEGTTFKKVVDELRRELATRYLTERDMAIAEIAFLLGFSEASAFHRAFKRWCGSTPADYRKLR
jgi:AraC-like DNA-binding protein